MSRSSPSRVCVVDCSKPHGEQMTLRPLTRKEQAQRDRDTKAALKGKQARAYLTLRAVRDELLRRTDHLEPDARWARWRQRLRDLPALIPDPEKPRWPKPPVIVSCLADYRGLWPRLDWTSLTEGTRP